MHRFTALLDRLRALGPARRDAMLAAALTLLMVVEVAVATSGATRLETLAAIPVLCAALLVHRRWPLPALAVAVAVFPLDRLAGGQLDEAFFPVVVLMVLMGHIAYALDARHIAAAVVIVAVGVAPIVDGTGAAFVAVAVGVLPIALGRTLRHQNRLAELLHERARGLEAEREARSRRAVEAERRRIAAELHDVVAHGVSAMVVQAAAARRLVAAGADAHGAIGQVETTGREALDELRRLLGVLRLGDEALALAPQPSLARVDRLVQRLRDEGLDVSLAVEGHAAPLPVGLDVMSHRILDAALADVLRRGPESTTAVTIRYRPLELELEVADDAPGAGEAGVGLRERVALFGGELHAGRRRGGGHVLRARLPVQRGAA